MCDTEYQTAVQSARYFGRLEAFKEFLELDIDQLTEQENG